MNESCAGRSQPAVGQIYKVLVHGESVIWEVAVEQTPTTQAVGSVSDRNYTYIPLITQGKLLTEFRFFQIETSVEPELQFGPRFIVIF